MATVTMRRGNQYAEIFDSAETIAQAQKDGFHICAKDESVPYKPEQVNAGPEKPAPENRGAEQQLPGIAGRANQPAPQGPGTGQPNSQDKSDKPDKPKR